MNPVAPSHFDSAEAVYARSWQINAASLEQQGVYEKLSGTLPRVRRILEIGAGSGSSSLALLKKTRLLISVEENTACAQLTCKHLQDHGVDVIHAKISDEGRVILELPEQGKNDKPGFICIGASITNKLISEWLHEIGGVDLITCWMVGTYYERTLESDMANADVSSPALYRQHVHSLVVTLANNILRPGGLLNIVDRGDVVHSYTEYHRTIQYYKNISSSGLALLPGTEIIQYRETAVQCENAIKLTSDVGDPAREYSLFSSAYALLEHSNHNMFDAEQSGAPENEVQSVLRYLHAGQLHDADQLLVELSKRYALDAQLFVMRSAAAGQRQEFDTAIQHCKTASALRPDYIDAYFNAGQCYMHRKEFFSATDCYLKVISLQRDHSAALQNVGFALERAHDYMQAVSAYRLAIQRCGTMAGLYVNLSNCLVRIRQVAEAIDAACKAVELDENNAEAHNSLAIAYDCAGRASESERSFRLAISIKPSYINAHSNLGGLLLKHGRLDEAVLSFQKVIELDPKHHSAGFVLAALGKAGVPSTAPPGYVAGLFDQYSENFEKHLVGVLQYKTHQLVADAALKHLRKHRIDKPRTLDLGCGSGLCGMLLRGVSRELTGVDLSRDMVKRAREKALYDKLIVGDLTNVLNESVERYELIVAADVLVYIGALETVFSGVALALCQGGIFVCSAECWDPRGEFGLKTTCRFGHSREYISSQARKVGIRLLKWDEVTLRLEKEIPVKGFIYAFRK